MKPPATYRNMTAREKDLALALGRCSFPTASFSKRFAGELAAAAAKGSGTITDKQAGRLEIQVWIYRRQIPQGLLPACAPAGYQTPKERWKAVDLSARVQQAIEEGKKGEAPDAETAPLQREDQLIFPMEEKSVNLRPAFDFFTDSI